MILSAAKITINFLILSMPLYKSIEVNSQTNVKIWQISEPLDFLTSNVELNSASLKRLSTMKSSIHKCGFLSVRMLLKAFGYTDQDLYYDHFGKPFLKDGRFISITHSHNFAAVVISNQQVGIDIEKQRAKIAKIALSLNFPNKPRLGIAQISIILLMDCKELMIPIIPVTGDSFATLFIMFTSASLFSLNMSKGTLTTSNEDLVSKK